MGNTLAEGERGNHFLYSPLTFAIWDNFFGFDVNSYWGLYLKFSRI